MESNVLIILFVRNVLVFYFTRKCNINGAHLDIQYRNIMNNSSIDLNVIDLLLDFVDFNNICFLVYLHKYLHKKYLYRIDIIKTVGVGTIQ